LRFERGKVVELIGEITLFSCELWLPTVRYTTVGEVGGWLVPKSGWFYSFWHSYSTLLLSRMLLRVKGFSTRPTVDFGLYHNYADVPIRELSFIIDAEAHNCRSCEIVGLTEEMSEMPPSWLMRSGGSKPFPQDR
jgi:hypothetical protein